MTWLLYGANGYTGALVARLAAARGEHPVLAGRSAGKVGALARELGLESRRFGLDDPGAIRRGLDGVITEVPLRWRTIRAGFPSGPRKVVSVPWGDVSTAYYSTGIGTITTYTAVPAGPLRANRALRLNRVLRLGPALRLAEAMAAR